VSESPARRARPQDREFSPRPRQQRPESRRPERPFEPRREFGSAHERPSRPERARGGPDRRGSSGTRPFDKARGPSGRGAADRTGSAGTRPFDKARGPKGPARSEQIPSRPASEAPARRAGSTDREFFSRPPKQRSESRHPERPFEPRREFGSARERPSRPERARGSPDRRSSAGTRPFDKARGPARGEGKFMAADRRPSRAPGRTPRNKSGDRPGR
jgi:hypothetical protein